MHFAELDPLTNEVIRVVVSDSREWCEQNLGGIWVRTYYSTPGKNYAGKGYKYHFDADNFSTPCLFSSWILDNNLIWQPPVPYPNDGAIYGWNEEAQAWFILPASNI